MNRKLFAVLIVAIQLVMVVLMAAPAVAADSGIVSGSVYIDSNGNSQPEPNESNVPNATVYVTREGESSPIVVTADADGFFVLAELPFGTYRVWAEDAEHNISAPEIVSLGEVNGAVSVELPIVHDLSDDIEFHAVNTIFLPYLNAD